MLRLALVAVAVIGIACHHRDDLVRADLDAYLRQMDSWGAVQGSTATALERILATEFVDDAAVLHEVAEARPRAEAHLTIARSYQPRTTRLADIHRGYVAAWERLLTGYDDVERGIRTATAADLAAGRRAFVAWRDGMTTTARDLRSLATELG